MSSDKFYVYTMRRRFVVNVHYDVFRDQRRSSLFHRLTVTKFTTREKLLSGLCLALTVLTTIAFCSIRTNSQIGFFSDLD